MPEVPEPPDRPELEPSEPLPEPHAPTDAEIEKAYREDPEIVKLREDTARHLRIAAVVLGSALNPDLSKRDDGSMDSVTPVELGPASDEVREDGRTSAEVRDYFERRYTPGEAPPPIKRKSWIHRIPVWKEFGHWLKWAFCLCWPRRYSNGARTIRHGPNFFIPLLVLLCSSNPRLGDRA